MIVLLFTNPYYYGNINNENLQVIYDYNILLIWECSEAHFIQDVHRALMYNLHTKEIIYIDHTGTDVAYDFDEIRCVSICLMIAYYHITKT